MRYQFTAGADRAIFEAAGWSSRGELCELEAPALLLGLLAETECRAATMLKQHGISVPEVRRRWPALKRLESRLQGPVVQDPSTERRGEQRASPLPFSGDVEASLSAAAGRLSEYPKPLTLATEHLLLGLAAAEHEVAIWLRQRGLNPDRLEAEIRQRYGHPTGPLPPGPQGPLDLAPGATPPAGGPSPPRGSRVKPEGGPEGSPQLPPSEQVRVLRVIDAAANRGREGLRVVEDYVRFVLDDRHLTDRIKRLRHDLTGLLARVQSSRRLAARETRADVGTSVSVASERHRGDAASVVAANFTRLQESLRSLEEFGKMLDPELAAAFEQLRYQSYTLQRAVDVTRRSLDRLAEARLYVLIDGQYSEERLAAVARSLVGAGVHVVQLRDKGLDDRRLLERARLLREVTRPSRTLLIINDRPDLAVLARADGVHVGQEDLSVKDVRTIVGPDALVGVSTHSIEQARQAVLDGADYIGLGPTFRSGTKHFDQFPGLELVRAVAGAIRLPAFAIGGITRSNVPQVLAAGLGRIAVSGAVTMAGDPGAAARELLAALEVAGCDSADSQARSSANGG